MPSLTEFQRWRPDPPPTGPVLVLDFDNTVCLGEGPVRAYAEAVAERLTPDDRTELLARIDDYLCGAAVGRPRPTAAPQDGYGVVWEFASSRLPPEIVSAAFARSRGRLVEEDLGLTAAPGAASLLASCRDSVFRILMTKSPGMGVSETLERIGLDDAFDLVLVAADKPRVWPALVTALAPSAPAGRRPLCSVGDHWVNDIESPLRLGCATAWITRLADPARTPLVQGAEIADVAPTVLQWADETRAITA